MKLKLISLVFTLLRKEKPELLATFHNTLRPHLTMGNSSHAFIAFSVDLYPGRI